MRPMTSEMLSESERDSLMAWPSSSIKRLKLSSRSKTSPQSPVPLPQPVYHRAISDFRIWSSLLGLPGKGTLQFPIRHRTRRQRLIETLLREVRSEELDRLRKGRAMFLQNRDPESDVVLRAEIRWVAAFEILQVSQRRSICHFLLDAPINCSTHLRCRMTYVGSSRISSNARG